MRPIPDRAAGVRAAIRLLRGGNESVAIPVLEELPKAFLFGIKHPRAASYMTGRTNGEASIIERLSLNILRKTAGTRRPPTGRPAVRPSSWR